MKNAICLKNIGKKYGENEVLKKINLEIKQGEFVCLLGPSGCGKSTLLRLLAGLDTPSEGKVFLEGQDATLLPARKRNFGIVFQSYALFPNLTAFENVAYGLRNKKMNKEEIIKIVEQYFDLVGLVEKKQRYPAQLSGGEQQRVALARALVMKPNFLLLDEPLSALDAKVRLKLRAEICRIQRELNLTTIMVTHDQEEALTMADRIVVMDKAEIMQCGTPQEIYEKPKNRFVADFIGAINFIENKNGSFKDVAIRPENIHISTTNSSNGVAARLKHIEFRGNFCRILAEALENQQTLFVDLPWQQVKKLSLHTGLTVFLHIEQDHMLKFGERGNMVC